MRKKLKSPRGETPKLGNDRKRKTKKAMRAMWARLAPHLRLAAPMAAVSAWSALPSKCGVEEDTFVSLMTASSLPDFVQTDFKRNNLDTVTKFIAIGGAAIRASVVTPATVNAIMAALKKDSDNDEEYGDPSGSDEEKTKAANLAVNVRLLIDHCAATYTEALARERIAAGAATPEDRSQQTAQQRAKWKQSPGAKVKEMIDLTCALYNTEMTRARELDPGILLETWFQMEDGKLKIAPLRSYGGSSLLMTDVEKSSGPQDRVIVYDSQTPAEMDLPNMRIAQVLSMIEAFGETLVVCSAPHTDAMLVDLARYPHSGNYGEVITTTESETAQSNPLAPPLTAVAPSQRNSSISPPPRPS